MPVETVRYKFEGNKDKAQSLFGYAKSLIPMLKNLMSYNKLTVYGIQKKFSDGTVIKLFSQFGEITVSVFCPTGLVIAEEGKIITEELYGYRSMLAVYEQEHAFNGVSRGWYLKLYSVTKGGEATLRYKLDFHPGGLLAQYTGHPPSYVVYQTPPNSYMGINWCAARQVFVLMYSYAYCPADEKYYFVVQVVDLDGNILEQKAYTHLGQILRSDGATLVGQNSIAMRAHNSSSIIAEQSAKDRHWSVEFSYSSIGEWTKWWVLREFNCGFENTKTTWARMYPYGGDTDYIGLRNKARDGTYIISTEHGGEDYSLRCYDVVQGKQSEFLWSYYTIRGSYPNQYPWFELRKSTVPKSDSIVNIDSLSYTVPFEGSWWSTENMTYLIEQDLYVYVRDYSFGEVMIMPYSVHTLDVKTNTSTQLWYNDGLNYTWTHPNTAEALVTGSTMSKIGWNGKN